MLHLDFDNTLILEQQQVLEAALSTNSETQKALQKLLRKVILQARAEVVKGIKFKNGDPRGTSQAVRTTVYRKVIGANINIYSSRKAHGSNDYEPPRKGSTGRGGNRRPRSNRTQQIMSYAPLDRGFILRWVNDGMTRTSRRTIQFKENDRRKVDKWNGNPNTGNRGSISARGFFGRIGPQALATAVNNLAILIDTELDEILNNKK